MDSLFEELVAIDSKAALNFFVNSLKDSALAERFPEQREDDTLYVASVLAHYSQTSRADTASIPSLANLSEVFDNFILHTSLMSDAEILEIGGSQILLFAGFFRDQMARRHNVEWYDHVGQSLYLKASHYSRDQKKRELFDHISESFPAWTKICSSMSRTCRENRLLLRLN